MPEADGFPKLSSNLAEGLGVKVNADLCVCSAGAWRKKGTREKKVKKR